MSRGRLRIGSIGTQALNDIVLEAGLIFHEYEKKWLDVMRLFISQAIAGAAYLGTEQGAYATIFFGRMEQTPDLDKGLRALLCGPILQPAKILEEAERRFQRLAEEMGAKIDCPVVTKVQTDSLSLRIGAEDGVLYEWTVRFTSSQQPGESVTIDIVISGSLEWEIRCFGMVLAGFVFGKICNGASRIVREARHTDFALEMSDCRMPASVPGETAAEALLRLTVFSAETAPSIVIVDSSNKFRTDLN